jgi:hypothetical protein
MRRKVFEHCSCFLGRDPKQMLGRIKAYLRVPMLQQREQRLPSFRTARAKYVFNRNSRPATTSSAAVTRPALRRADAAAITRSSVGICTPGP